MFGSTMDPRYLAAQSAAQQGPAPAGLTDAQRQYMNTHYTGQWDEAYWTPERFIAAFGADGQGPKAPEWPVVIPYTGTDSLAGLMGAGQAGQAGQAPRNIKRYGFGPQHAWFSGHNGKPYGLASIMAGQQVTGQQAAPPAVDQLVEEYLTRRGGYVPGIDGGP